MSDVQALAEQAALFGAVAPVFTARLVVLSLGEDEPAGIRAASRRQCRA